MKAHPLSVCAVEGGECELEPVDPLAVQFLTHDEPRLRRSVRRLSLRVRRGLELERSVHERAGRAAGRGLCAGPRRCPPAGPTDVEGGHDGATRPFVFRVRRRRLERVGADRVLLRVGVGRDGQTKRALFVLVDADGGLRRAEVGPFVVRVEHHNLLACERSASAVCKSGEFVELSEQQVNNTVSNIQINLLVP